MGSDLLAIGPSSAPELRSYLEQVTGSCRVVLGGELLGLYVVGSVAWDDVGPHSDLDLIAIADRSLSGELAEQLARRLVRGAVRCPLRGIEYVAYAAQVVAAPRHPVDYELNVNAGPAMSMHVSRGHDPAHWFTLDLAMARTRSVPLHGPPLDELVGPLPDEDVVVAIEASLDWHLERRASTPDAVLNACRGLLYLRERRWASKTSAARWALNATEHQELIEAALRARAPDVAGAGEPPRLDPAAVSAFVREVRLLTR